MSVADAGELIAALLVQNLLFVGLAVWIWRRQRLTCGQIGLIRPSLRQALLALGMGVGVFGVAYISGTLLEHALQVWLPSQTYAELVRRHGQVTAEGSFRNIGRSLWLKVAFVISGTVIAPLGEEALFRGLIYRTLRARWGVRVAVVASSALFAAVHMSPLIFCSILLIGIMLACAYERSGSLWTPVLMHAVNNALMFALLWQRTR